MPIPIAAGLAAKTLLSTAATTAARSAPTLIKPLAQQATKTMSQLPLAATARHAASGGVNQLRSNLLPALKQSAIEHGKQALVDGALAALQQSLSRAPRQPGMVSPVQERAAAPQPGHMPSSTSVVRSGELPK